MSALAYQAGIVKALSTIDLTAASKVKALLVTSGYTPNKDHVFVSAITPGSNELSGSGYERKTFSSFTVTADDTNDRAVMDGENLTWTSINAGVAAAVILFLFVTNDADSVLFLYIDTGGFPVTTNGGDMTITWSSSGIAYIG